MKFKCSRCEQVFDDEDSLFEVRKSRHELGRHTRHVVYSERDGSKSKPLGNFDYGKVEWTIHK